METHNKNGLNTYTTVGNREYVESEPINFNGASDWWGLSDLRDAMFNNLNLSVLNEYDKADVPENRHNEFTASLNAIKSLTAYREDYLRRRIRQLEQALNLTHNEDIDS